MERQTQGAAALLRGGRPALVEPLERARCVVRDVPGGEHPGEREIDRDQRPVEDPDADLLPRAGPHDRHQEADREEGHERPAEPAPPAHPGDPRPGQAHEIRVGGPRGGHRCSIAADRGALKLTVTVHTQAGYDRSMRLALALSLLALSAPAAADAA